MNLNIRPLNETDYDTILIDWWKDWGWEPPKKDFLPLNGVGGMIVFDGDTPVCAGFTYTTNSAVAWVDWIISNKKYRKKPERGQAIEGLISSLTEVCKSSEHKYVYALIKSRPLIEVYKRLGYSQADSYTTEMIKRL